MTLLAADPAGLGEPQDVDGLRVTLLQLTELAAGDLAAKDGKPAKGGRRLWWLVEPREGSREAPAIGNVRLTLGGRPVSDITRPTAKSPFAPDLVVRDYGDAAGLVPTPQLPPRPGSTVAEVIIRGPQAIKPTAVGVAEVQISTGKTTVWVKSRTY